MIGRFPIYLENAPTDDESKWQFVLNLIKRIDGGVHNFLLAAPDGTLRIIGPFQVKSGDCLIICSPLPALFKFLVLTIPRFVKAVVKPKNAFVDIKTKKELFTEPGKYVLKIKNAESISFKQLSLDFEMFLGIRLKPKYVFEHMKNSGIYTYLNVIAENKDATALLNFSRYAGFGTNRKYGRGDVEIFRIAD